MAKKSLSSREWKAFVQQRTVAPDLLTALSRLEKTSDTADALTLLEEIEAEAKALARTHAKDKDLCEYLDGLRSAATERTAVLEKIDRGPHTQSRRRPRWTDGSSVTCRSARSCFSGGPVASTRPPTTSGC